MLQALLCFQLEFGKGRFNRVRFGAHGVGDKHRRQIMLNIDQQATERRSDTRIGGHNHGRDRELARQRNAMQGAGATKRDQREIAWVVTAHDRDPGEWRRPCWRWRHR